jgi:hypothetical protein
VALVNSRVRGPRVLIIVPTHDHASTLDVAVSSALAQTIADLDVAIVGDGVGDDTREVANELGRRDERVRFIDLPKSPSRNEGARHELIMDTDAEIVTYLGDDDLFFPDHVETMVQLLESHDFAHPLPVFVGADDGLDAHPTDVGDERCVQWHLQQGFNTIGLTGASHTSALYRQLPNGWTEPPSGWWSDHYFWTQIFRHPDVRLATSRRCTVIKHPATQSEVPPAERRQMLLTWSDRIGSPGFESTFATMVNEAIRVRAVDEYRNRTLHELTIAGLKEEIASAIEHSSSLSRRLDDAVHHAERLGAQLADAEALATATLLECDTIRQTRTWRLRNRLLASSLGNIARAMLTRRDSTESAA